MPTPVPTSKVRIFDEVHLCSYLVASASANLTQLMTLANEPPDKGSDSRTDSKSNDAGKKFRQCMIQSEFKNRL